MKMTDEMLRQKLKRYFRRCERIHTRWIERGGQGDPPALPLFPDQCRGMSCGAKTRSGTPCKRKDLHRSGRCRLHGGLSTGPKTLEGKRRSALNTGKTYEALIAGRISKII